MVKGIGIDVLSVDEFGKRLARTPRLKLRLFTERELDGAYSLENLAGKFALKEAILKAMGTGLSGGIRWRDVEILGGKTEPPRAVLYGRAKELAKGTRFLLSVSHAAGVVVGVCVAISSDT